MTKKSIIDKIMDAKEIKDMKKENDRNPTMKTPNSYELTLAGKKAAIDSFFGIPLEDQDIPKSVNESQNAKKVFESAYKDTMARLKLGVVPEYLREYYEIAKENYENKELTTKKHR